MKLENTGFRRGKGFTLIELLVVIAIIAILASMLVPVITKAKEVSKSTVCLNNLKQLGLASTMYADDFNNYMPYTICGDALQLSSWYPFWFIMVSSYGGFNRSNALTGLELSRDLFASGDPSARRLIFHCPGRSGNYSGTFRGAWYAPPRLLLTYPEPDVTGFKSTQIKSPAKRIWLADTHPSYNTWAFQLGAIVYAANIDLTKTYAYAQDKDPACSVGRTAAIHNKSTNCAFFDGHAETINFNTLLMHMQYYPLSGGKHDTGDGYFDFYK